MNPSIDDINLITIILSLAGTGVLAGVMAGMLGIGGGLVLVPVLYYIFMNISGDPVTALATATATSLSIIVPTSISSIAAHYRRGNIESQILKDWWAWIVLGVLLASAMVTWLRGPWLQVFFSTFVIVVGLKMLTDFKLSIFPTLKQGSAGARIIPVTIGFASTLVGIGGGTLTVPILSTKGYSMSRAIGTSAAVGFIISLPAALSLLFASATDDSLPYTIGLVNIAAFLLIAPISMLFAPVGAKFSQIISPFYLKKIFSLVLISTGIRIALQIS